MKRLLPLLLVLCLLPNVPVSASSAFKAEFTAPTSVYTGTEFSLAFSFSNLPAEGLCGIDLELEFDKDLVSFVSASISGFPSSGNWCGVGRVENGKYLYFIFDDYSGTAAPVSVYDGAPLSVTFTFKAKPGAEGDAVFSVSRHGAVAGTVFDTDGASYIYGVGCADKTVSIVKAEFPDSRGNGWYVKGGVMYVRPGITAGELADIGVLSGSDGVAKAADTPAFGGDTFSHLLYAPVEVAIAMDIDMDGRFTTSDYLLLQMHLKGLRTLKGNAYNAADADGDGAVTNTDASMFKLALEGKRYPF